MRRSATASIFFAQILFWITGFIQAFAVYSGASSYLGWGKLPSLLATLFLSWIPILGSALGAAGAHYAWNWSWVSSIALYTWHLPVLVVLAIFSTKAES
jgi:hypothetical protein